MFAALLLAASVVENAVIQSPQLGTFFALPQWMPTVVGADRTPGSIDSTNMTHRIDATALATVNACFEAYYERLYYGYAGPSNSWDVEVYGPTCRNSEKEKFRFGLPTNAPSPFVYAPDTNRVIETRRLVEYDNMKCLSDVMRTADFMTIDRPGWWSNNGENGWKYPTSNHVMWSSTLFDGLETNFGTVGEPFPSVAWRGAESFLQSQGINGWFDVALGWPHTQNGILSWYNQGSNGYDVANIALDDVNYGEDEMTINRNTYVHLPILEITNTADSIVGEGKYICSEYLISNEHSRIIHVLAEDACVGLYNDVRERTRHDYSAITGSVELAMSSYSFDGISTVSVDFEITFSNANERSSYSCSYDVDISEMLDDSDELFNIEFDPVSVNGIRWWWSLDQTFGGGKMWVLHEDPYRWEYTNYGTLVIVTKKTISTTYVHGVDGLTNDTRRLVTDRLAGLGLTLGALDRTYAKINPPIPTVVTQRYHAAERNYSSTTDSAISGMYWDYVDGVWRTDSNIIDVQPLQRSSEYYTNGVRGAKYVDGRYVSYMTEAKLGLSYGVSSDAHQSSAVTIDEQGLLSILVGGPESGRGDFIIHFENLFANQTDGHAFLSGEYQIRGKDPYEIVSSLYEIRLDGLPECPSNVVYTVFARTETSYESGVTYGLPNWTVGHVPYPGDYDRISRTSYPLLWDVIGVASVIGTIWIDEVFSIPDANGFRSSTFESTYYAGRTTYANLTGLKNAFENDYLRLTAKARDVFGRRTGISDTSKVLDVLSSLESGLSQKSTFSGFELYDVHLEAILSSGVSLTSRCDRASICGVHGYFDSDGIPNVSEVMMAGTNWNYYTESPPGSGVYTLGSWNISSKAKTRIKSGYEPITTNNINGIIINGKMSTWSKVDWDWKALKRTNKTN